MRRRRGAGSVYKQPGCKTYMIKYYRGGRAIREATGVSDYQAARQMLNRKLGKLAEGTFVEPRIERMRVEELMGPFFRQQLVDGSKDSVRAERRWKRHLEPFFGGRLITTVGTDDLNLYVDQRLRQGARPATVNREIAVLRGAFRLGAKSTPPKVQMLPAFPHLDERNIRTGFVEDKQFTQLAAQTSDVWLRAMLEMGYEYGWRRGELAGLRVRNVDLSGRTIRLDPRTTKNDEGRTVVMTSAIFALMAQCVDGKTAEDFVFTRNGKPIGDFRKRWRKVTIAAGVPGLLFHDLRRSGVRNLVRAGVSEKVAMKITGHKTRDVFDRYDITSERDLEDAARKSEARRKAAEASDYKHDFGHDRPKTEPSTNERVN
jgi:integrase